MNSTGSMILTIIERIRAYLDDADINAKYDNDYLVRHIISPGMVDIVSRLSNTTGVPIVHKLSLTVTEGQLSYKMPPNVHEVLRIVTKTADGLVLTDALPQHPTKTGAGWRLEGNPGALELIMDVNPVGVPTLELWYVDNGDFLPCYGTGTLDATKTIVTLTASPTFGALDRRESAYVGATLRLLPPSPSAIEERSITAHVESAGVWTATVGTAFTKAAAGTVTYEIAPAGAQALYEAIALWGAMKLGVARKVSQNHYVMMTQHYRAAMKTIGDNLTNAWGRESKRFYRDYPVRGRAVGGVGVSGFGTLDGGII